MARIMTYSERKRKAWRKQRDKLKAKINEEFGSSCIICGQTDYLVLHQINFEEHRIVKQGNTNMRYYLKHPTEFIQLCYWCHKILHVFAKYPQMKELLPI